MDHPDDLISEIQAIDAGARERSGIVVTLKKVRYSHDAMIDIIIANPWVHQNELAAHFGYSPAWISIVMSTDMFKARLEQRKAEVVDPALRASLTEHFQAVVKRSLVVLQEKLERPSSSVPDNLALRAAEMGAKALGLGGNAPPAAQTFPADHLVGLADRLVALQSRARNSERNLDVQDVTVVSEGPQSLGRPSGPPADAAQASQGQS